MYVSHPNLECHYLLYSRSLTRDFRWMLVSPNISSYDLKMLTQLFSAWRSSEWRGASEQSQFHPLFGLNLTTTYALVTVLQIEHKDAFSRPLACLQGIAIPYSLQKDLSSITQHILGDYKSVLNAWKHVDFKDADQIENSIATVSFSQDQLQANIPIELLRAKQKDHLNYSGNQVILSSDDEALKGLRQYIALSDSEVLNFAFAVPSQMLKIFEAWQIKFDLVALTDVEALPASVLPPSNAVPQLSPLPISVTNLAPPPPTPLPSAPPPRFPVQQRLSFVLIATAFLLGIFPLLFSGHIETRFLFASKMLLLLMMVCVTPTVASYLTKRQGRVVRVTVETLLFVFVFLAFGYWLIGNNILGIWIAYAAILVFLLEAGAHFVEHHKNAIYRRLSRSMYFKYVRSNTEDFEKLFYSELVLYISVPLGLISGIGISLVRSQTPEETITLALKIILLLASLTLLFFLVSSFIRMKDPLFREVQVSSQQITNELALERKGCIRKIGKVLRFLVPEQKLNSIDQKQKDLDLAYLVADLRKVYLYDATHNVTLLVAFIVTMFGLLSIPITIKWLVASLIGFSLVFNQLPYVLGQLALHEQMLERYEGIERADMAENLKKYSPLFPTSDFLATLFTTGTAGGLLYFLIDNLIKEAFK